MMKKRKFGSGGMPSMKESMESGNRVSEQVGKETKKLMPATRSTRPSVGDAIASGNRMSKKNAEDLKAVKKYAKGGKVKRYADGDLVMGDAANKTSGLDLGLGLPKDIGAELSRAATDKELMDANLAAVRAREAASKAKPKPKPKADAPTKKAETPVKKAETPVKKAETPANKPAGMRVGSESAGAAREGLRRGARASGEAIKTVARGVGSTPSRAARALESANEQTKTQSRNMAKLREKNPNLVDRFIKMTMNPGMAKGGVTRADGIAKKGKTKGKMR
jgi:hypothetical protein